MPFHFDGHVSSESIARHVLNAYLVVLMQFNPHRTYGRIQTMHPLVNATEMSQSYGQTNRTVTAHVENTHVVEENNAGNAIGFGGLH
jgi:hypothetical protein